MRARSGRWAHLPDEGSSPCTALAAGLLAGIGAMARPHVRIMDFTGRPMRGYVFVGSAAFLTDVELKRWVDEYEAHVVTLPDKPSKRSRSKRRGKTSAGREASRRKARVASRRS